MSVVTIKITTQPKDGGQSTYGGVPLQLLVQGIIYDISLALSPSAGYKKFQEVLWFAPQDSSDFVQHRTYIAAINRDFADTGGRGNINARIVGDTLEISAKVGTFQGGDYTGNILSSVTFDYDNSVQLAISAFNFAATGAGNCDTVDYVATGASGGIPPYRLILGDANLIENWDGDTDETFSLNRSGVFSGGLYDSNGALIKVAEINPPKKISSADFKPRVTAGFEFSDVRVDTAVVRDGTGPLEYNIVDENGIARGWQESDSFGAVPPGTYELRVRDVYLCEVSKTFFVTEITSPLEENRVPYFSVSEFNSLSYFNEVTHSNEIRKNYENTPSWCENVAISKNGVFEFPASSEIPQQFRSSYPNHRVTLFRREMQPMTLQFFEIQRNLGVVEKVDCKMFLIFETLEVIGGGTINLSSGTGVYFEGGVQYEPSSTTPKTDPESPYNGSLPRWAQKGNLVEIDGEGVFEILETDLFDPDREVLYFRIAERFSDRDALIQGSWDRHPYNVFRFELSMANVFDKGSFIRIEPGVLSGADFLVDINNIHRSEYLVRLEDTSKHIKIKYSAFRNIGEMSFTDGIQCEMWIRGRVRPYSDTDSTTDDAADRTNSVDQEALIRMRGFFPLMSPRRWRKLDLIGTIGNRGQVFIEGMELVKISASEQAEQGTSNMSNVSVEFAYSGESTAVSQEDPVFSVDTGLTVVPGSTGKTGRSGVEDWEVGPDEKRLATVEGEWVKVIDLDGNENYVIIP